MNVYFFEKMRLNLFLKRYEKISYFCVPNCLLISHMGRKESNYYFCLHTALI